MKNKKPKILALLEKAEYELGLYERHHRFTNLSQACEKTWVAFTLFLELKSGKEINAKTRPRPLAVEFGYSDLWSVCDKLHILHYEGSPDSSFEDNAFDIRRASEWIRAELEKGE